MEPPYIEDLEDRIEINPFSADDPMAMAKARMTKREFFEWRFRRKASNPALQ
jgi:hypothetical protein